MSSPCNCIANFNAKLAPEHELDLSLAFTCGESPTLSFVTYTPLIRTATKKPERRSGKPGFAAHTFCPFCGISLKGNSPASQPETDRYPEAKGLVLTSRKASCSYLQRAMGIGYNQAVGFMERMEAEGLVGVRQPTGMRKLLAISPPGAGA